MTAANIRTGMARITTHPKFEDETWSPVKVAMAGFLDAEMPNKYRFLNMGLAALEEVMEPFVDIPSSLGTIPLLVGMPGERAGLHSGTENTFSTRIRSVEYRHRVRFKPEFLPYEHAAGLIALKNAILKLENKEAEFCVAGGIESYMSLKTLKWLEETENLKCSNNKWGFIPGEAAGFYLLATTETVKKHRLSSLAQVIAVADAKEEQSDSTESVCVGNGLSQAFARVLDSLSEGEQINQVYCDMNGQRHRIDEYSYTLMRMGSYFEDPNAIIAPANLWGDLGAASAPLLISLVTEAARKGYARGNHHLVFTSALNGHRAAALLKLSSN